MNSKHILFLIIIIVLSSTVSSQVVLQTWKFNPTTLPVYKGTQVNWTVNNAGSHIIKSLDGLFTSGSLNTGDTYSHIFNETGTFQYKCDVHGAETGSITVSINPSTINYSLMNITLLEPSYGASFVTMFDLKIKTSNASNCRYSAFADVNYNDIHNEVQHFEKLNGGFTHVIENYVLNTPDNVQTSLYVKCKADSNGYINEKSPLEIKLSVDTTPPLITSLIADPPQVIERLEVDLIAETDDDTYCIFKVSNTTDMSGTLSGVTDEDFKKKNKQTFNRSTDPRILDMTDYLFFVGCINRAEQETLDYVFFNVNLSVANDIVELSPAGFINDRETKIRVATNKDSTCKFGDGYKYSFPQSKRDHFYDERNLSEKTYTVPVKCRFSTGEEKEGIVYFTVDRTKPTSVSIKSADTTCNPNYLSAEFSANDQLPIEYTVRLLDSNNSEVYKTLTNLTKVEIFNKSLKPGKTYFWEVTATDAIGNKASPKKSLGTDILLATHDKCAGNPAPYMEISGSLSEVGITLNLLCKDDEPPCKTTYFMLTDTDSSCICETCNYTKYLSTTEILLNEDKKLCYNITDKKSKSILNFSTIEYRTCVGNESCCVGKQGFICQNNCTQIIDLECFPEKIDTDADGIPDIDEIKCGLDINDATDALFDLDEDGLTNMDECIKYGSNLTLADTDGDGYNDKVEIEKKTDFNDPDDYPIDSSTDTDDDGIPDLDEIECGLDPKDADDAYADDDSDGLDNQEECVLYGTDIDNADTDGDGYPDKEEIDKKKNPKNADDFPKSYVLNILAFIIGLGLLSGGGIIFAKNMKTTPKLSQPKNTNKPLVNFDNAKMQMSKNTMQSSVMTQPNNQTPMSYQQNYQADNINYQPSRQPSMRARPKENLDMEIKKKREEIRLRQMSSVFDDFAQEEKQMPNTQKRQEVLKKQQGIKDKEGERVFDRLDDISKEDAYEEMNRFEKKEEKKFGKIKADDILDIDKKR